MFAAERCFAWGMRIVPADESGDAWRRAQRDQARREEEILAPRPGHPIYGLSAPSLTPAAVTGHGSYNDEWISVTLAYGPWDAPNGPYVEVTTEATDAGMRVSAGRGHIDDEGPEGYVRNAIENELDRVIALSVAAGPDAGQAEAGEAPESDEAPVFSRQALPPGEAVVGRSGEVWAAWLEPEDPALSVALTIVGRGVDPDSIRLQTVTDLQPLFEARAEITRARIERARRTPRPPLPALEPAEGVAALRALAEFTLAGSERRRGELRDRGARREARQSQRQAAGWGGMYSALWQRAVREQQRLRGVNAATADYAVTEVVNHLGFLGEKALWFGADSRLRAAAIDETLRRAMLGDAVPSEPAQEAWARHWSAHMTRLPLDLSGADPRAVMAEREAGTAACLRAWAEWAETA